jgi:integrase
MGTIRKIGKNFQIDACRKGVRIRKIVGPSKRLAKEVLADIEAKLVRGEFGLDQHDCLIEDLFERFSTYAGSNMAGSSGRRYQNVVDRFREFLQTEPRIKLCSHLDLGVIERFRQLRLATPDPPKTKSMNFELKGLRTIFRYGVKWGMCGSDPTQGIKFQKITDARPYRILTKKEVMVLLDSSPSDMKAIILGFLLSGMRLGELEHLTWDDVDFNNDLIRIRYKSDWRPKTGERDIAMSPELRDLLLDLHRCRGKEHPYVFTLEGRPSFEGAIRKRLIVIARRAGLEGVTSIHSLRHTFGSLLVEAGVPLPVVKDLLGHSDIRMTMTYVHTTRDEHRRAVEKLNFHPDRD